MSVRQIQKELLLLGNPQKAKILSGFFKTGEGQYAQGDKFLGIIIPEIRKVAQKHCDLEIVEIIELLHSEIHENRVFALFVLVSQFTRGNNESKKKIYDIYLANTKYINNWDLVDMSADKIVGSFLENKTKDILLKLADSQLLWERRIAILATFHFIKKGEYEWTFKIAEKLLGDKHDLIHKAVGWMLREVGKRCSQEGLEKFIKKNISRMPRTTLRYAIERFDEKKRQYYLALK